MSMQLRNIGAECEAGHRGLQVIEDHDGSYIPDHSEQRQLDPVDV